MTSQKDANYATPRLVQQSEQIEELLPQVSQSLISHHIEQLSSQPRDTLERQTQAASYIISTLKGYGYNPTLDAINGWPYSPGNIIAKLEGSINPGTKFLIGAHYDSVYNSPGADDNASSVAGALEIARVLQDFQPDSTIEFVFFGAEEAGLLGSKQYAQEAAANEDVITGMVSLEMIGYYSDKPNSQYPYYNTSRLRVSEEGVTVGDYIGAVGDTNSYEFLQAFGIVANHLVGDLRVLSAETGFTGQWDQYDPNTLRSDHAPFWYFGYEALMLTDTAEARNPNYHKATDTVDTLSTAFTQQVTQATLATAIITTSLLVVEGSEGKDNLYGTSRTDKLNGYNGKDILTGLEGNDILIGGNGKDILIGVNPHTMLPGYREIDTLAGGNGPDEYVLGDSSKAYYCNHESVGLKDYAMIKDLDKGDSIQLHGSIQDYLLLNNYSVDGMIGSGIFLKNDNGSDLIGFVQGIANLAVAGRHVFSFV
jgi:Ca2+-binding RTX toxin-like protein